MKATLYANRPESAGDFINSSQDLIPLKPGGPGKLLGRKASTVLCPAGKTAKCIFQTTWIPLDDLQESWH